MQTVSWRADTSGTGQAVANAEDAAARPAAGPGTRADATSATVPSTASPATVSAASRLPLMDVPDCRVLRRMPCSCEGLPVERLNLQGADEGLHIRSGPLHARSTQRRQTEDLQDLFTLVRDAAAGVVNGGARRASTS